MGVIARLLPAGLALLLAACDRGKSHVAPSATNPVAVGRLLIQPPPEIATSSSDGDAFFEEQNRTILSDSIRATAENRVLQASPQMKPSLIALQVARASGGSVVVVTGRGSDLECARSLVDAVMEAYVETMRLKDPVKAAAAGDEASVEKELADAELAWNTMKFDHDPVKLGAELAALDLRAKRLGAAKNFCQQELELSSKLSLEQDIERRRTAIPPADVPAEMAAILRAGPTPTELAHIAASKKSGGNGAKASLEEATKDRAARTEMLRKQIEVVDELMKPVALGKADIEKRQAEAKAAESRARAAQTRYADFKSKEKEARNQLSTGTGAMVSITEFASQVVKK